MYIGGAQKRPDAPYARPVFGPSGKVIGQVSEGNRKDIREAVEAAHKAAPGYGDALLLVCNITVLTHTHTSAGGRELLTIELKLSITLLRI